MFLAAVLYSIGGLCIKLIPWGGMAINGARTAIALAVIGAYLILTRHKPRMNPWVLVGAVAVCGTNILFSIANKLTTAANTIVLQFTAPIFMMNDMPDSDAISSVFWGDVISAAVGLPFLGYESDFSPSTLTALLVLGVFQVGLAYILLTEGLKTTPPVTASLVSGIEPVLNPILVAVFYHEMIGPIALVGAMVVVGSVVLYNAVLARQSTMEYQSYKGETEK